MGLIPTGKCSRRIFSARRANPRRADPSYHEIHMRLAALFLIACGAVSAAVPLTDIDGKTHDLLDASSQRANVLYFITNDCPISNQYAPKINRICSEYAAQGVGCYLVYIDPTLSRDAIRKHMADYSHDCCPALHDVEHKLVERVGAEVTPEAALLSAAGEALYQGRIDNFYAALGKPRRMVTVHDLRDALEAALAGEPIANPKTQAVGCFIPDRAVYDALQEHKHERSGK